MIKNLESVLNEFENHKRHPFISDKSLTRLSDTIKVINGELNISKNEFSDQILNDFILERIDKLYTDKVGETYSEEEFKTIYKEGEDRFLKKVPPGFRDASKTEKNSEGTKVPSLKKFNDYIIWKQIIDYSKVNNKNIIFITDDSKVDWWLDFKGKKLQAQPQLIDEFKKETNQNLYIYQSDRFIDYAQKALDLSISPDAIEEIRELRESKEIRQNVVSIDFTIESKESEAEGIRQQIRNLQYRIKQARNLTKLLENQRNELLGDYDLNDPVKSEPLRLEADLIGGRIKMNDQVIKKLMDRLINFEISLSNLVDDIDSEPFKRWVNNPEN